MKNLETLYLNAYDLDPEIIKSISEIQSLVELELVNHPSKNSPDIYPISNLKNLEILNLESIGFEATDKFLINLSENAKNLRDLNLSFSEVTDFGLMSLTKLKKLETLKMLREDDAENLTDASIERFKNMKIFDCFGCNYITDYSIIKLIKNSPDLESLNVESTDVSWNVLREAARITRERKNNITLEIIVHFHDVPKDTFSAPEYCSPFLLINNTDFEM